MQLDSKNIREFEKRFDTFCMFVMIFTKLLFEMFSLQKITSVLVDAISIGDLMYHLELMIKDLRLMDWLVQKMLCVCHNQWISKFWVNHKYVWFMFLLHILCNYFSDFETSSISRMWWYLEFEFFLRLWIDLWNWWSIHNLINKHGPFVNDFAKFIKKCLVLNLLLMVQLEDFGWFLNVEF